MITETESNLKQGREFKLYSSFGPNSQEVMSMRDQIRQGRPTSAYEFVQGMVDYGKDFVPPPRIVLVYKDGAKIDFDGKSKISKKNLASIEFKNSGHGLAPEDTTIIMHGGGANTLGQWGRGTSVTLAFLESTGMHTEIESNVDGRAWKGSTSLTKTEAGKTEVLTVLGQWLPEQSNTTIFRVNNPDKDFVSQVEQLPSYFLPANPNADPIIVEADPSFKSIPLDFALDKRSGAGRVRCLKDKIAAADDTSVFVDGLRVTARSWGKGDFKFAWALDGFKSFGYPFGIQRSHDSRYAEPGDPIYPIQVALRHNLDPEIYRQMLIDSVDENRLPLEVSKSIESSHLAGWNDFQAESKELLLKVFRKEFGDVILGKDIATVEKYRSRFPDKRVKIIRGAMYDWLKEAGAVSCEQILGIEKMENFSAGKEIRVEYASDPDNLTKLFLEAADCFADLKVEAVDGKKAVRIRFPYSVHTEADFFDRKKPGAQWLRVAAIVAQELGLGIEINSYLWDKVHSLEYDVKKSWRGNNTFDTNLSDAVKSGPMLSKDFSDGYTEAILTGDVLQKLEPPPSLADSLQSIAMERAEKLRGRHTDYKKDILERKEKNGDDQKTGISRRGFLRAAVAFGGLGAVAYYLKGVGWADSKPGNLNANIFYQKLVSNGFSFEGLDNQIGNPSSNLGVYELNYRAPRVSETDAHSPESFTKGTRYESRDSRIGMTGLYREFTGAIFARNKASGRGHWLGTESFESFKVEPVKPDDYRMRIRFKGFAGQKRIVIKENEIVKAAVGGNVEILKDKHNGNFIIRGFGEDKEVDVYTGVEQTKNTDPPNNEETRRFLNFQNLRKDWQLMVARLHETEFSNTEKAIMILAKWGKGYVYSDKNALDQQVVGSSPEEIATKTVNLQKGICNTSATGYVALLREVGVPARVVVGQSVSDRGQVTPHMWAEYWTGQYWEEAESLYGSQTDPDTLKRQQAYLETVKNSEQSRKTEQKIDQQADQLNKLEKMFPGISKKEAAWLGIGLAAGAALKTLIDRVIMDRE